VNATHHRLHSARLHLRASSKKRPKSAIVGDINVTPLVDVVLVLLIIFMVVTPMIARGVQVDLPQTMHHSKKPDDGKDIIISVTADKSIYLSGTRVLPDNLGRLVKDERRRFPDKAFYIKGDSRTTYGAVRGVMEKIHELGVEDIMLGTDEVKQRAAQ
jgi:biopolymer transport protein ExbD/biopolymer transport protein TolR